MITPDLSPNGKAALAYASKLNWSVFPLHTPHENFCSCKNPNCKSAGKHPRTKNGLKAATTNLDVITQWWKKWPDANIAIATGEVSGFIALDVDPRHGGDESLKALTGLYGTLPDTIEAITGGGGQHILFKNPGQVKNQTNIVSGLDVRGDGGYIAVSPSLHISGSKYEWELSSRPLEVELADIPEWLLKLIAEPGKNEPKPVTHWREIAQGVGEGQRNQAVAALTGRLLSRGFDPIEAAALVMAWNTCYNQPPLPDHEVSRTIDSIAKREWNRRNGGGATG